MAVAVTVRSSRKSMMSATRSWYRQLGFGSYMLMCHAWLPSPLPSTFPHNTNTKHFSRGITAMGFTHNAVHLHAPPLRLAHRFQVQGQPHRHYTTASNNEEFQPNDDASINIDSRQNKETKSNRRTSNDDPFRSLIVSTLDQQMTNMLQSTNSSTNPTDIHKNQQRIDRDHIIMVLCISGGSDSMALFRGMMDWREHHRKHTLDDDIHFIVAHFNHQQRGSDSDLDQALVQDACQQHNVDCHVYYWNNSTAKSSVGDSFSQDAARQWRQQSCQQLIEQLAVAQRAVTPKDAGQANASININDTDNSNHATSTISTISTISTTSATTITSTSTSLQKSARGYIVTAHHREDSYESMLLKLIRGVHLSNLQGMDVVAAPLRSNLAPSATTNTANTTATTTTTNTTTAQLFRPFLPLTKDDLRNYLLEQDCAWREDSSNTSPKYLRNRVRNELMPLLDDLMSSGASGGDDNTETSIDGIHPHSSPTSGTILHQRLDALEEQSRMVQDDANQRVEAYLSQHIDRGTGGDANYLNWAQLVEDRYQGSTTPFIQNQVLHRWIKSSVSGLQEKHHHNLNHDHDRDHNNKDGAMTASEDAAATTDDTSSIHSSSPSNVLSYQALSRVWDQLQNFPERKRWKVELGQGYSVVRMGDILSVSQKLQNSVLDEIDGDIYDGGKQEFQEVEWCITTTESGEKAAAVVTVDDGIAKLEICIDEEIQTQLQISAGNGPSPTIDLPADGCKFICTTVAAWPAPLYFVPSWRRGRSSTKLRQFLRGQGVPLHQRESVSVLILARVMVGNMDARMIDDFDVSSSRLVAVLIPNKGWVIHDDYCSADD